jgi:hypothetical protein
MEKNLKYQYYKLATGISPSARAGHAAACV